MSTLEEVIAATMKRIEGASATDAANTLSDGYFWGDVGPSMSCSEAEALAVLMHAQGVVPLRELASLVVEGHGDSNGSEDEGDDHYVGAGDLDDS